MFLWFAYDYQEIFCNEYDLSENIANQSTIITRGYPYLIQLIGFYMWEFLLQEEALAEL